MNLEDLNAFVKIYEIRNISEAAIAVNLTQSALSKRMKHLQADLKVKLLDTSNRQFLQITSAGETFYHYAKLMSDQYQALLQALRQGDSQRQGQLKIGSVPVVRQYGLSQALTRFMADFPNINVSLNELEGQDLLRLLRFKGVDVAILRDIQVQDLALTDYVVQTIARDQLVLVGSINGPLAQVKQAKISDLANYAYALLPPGSGVFEYANQLFAQNGHLPAIPLQTSHIGTITDVLQNSQQVSLLFQQAIDPAVAKKLKIVPFEKPIFSNLVFIYPKDNGNPAIQAFLKYVVNLG
ncbi:MAG: LysR family transcriptional regulator [Lactobacillus sp.]|jgi:DNA-binding transcriptional LysR family regulator|nr:LysR family transcriptional regulator [Lactobacillus sp.]